MNLERKALPPLPGNRREKANQDSSTPKRPPPPPLAQRPIQPNRGSDVDVEELYQQLRALNRENGSLRRELAIQKKRNRESAEFLAASEKENHRRKREIEKQNELVTQIARTVSVAFQDYQESMTGVRQTTPTAKQSEGSAGDIQIHYSDLLSEFSDNSE
ncbi:hypothetical protein V8F33_008498 [Rhypophila sp. PSN 637]